jgi:hypothetical protein
MLTEQGVPNKSALMFPVLPDMFKTSTGVEQP